MAFHRTILVAAATVLVTGMTSAAFAGCGGCGWGPSVQYAPAPVYGPGGCGGCGLAPAVVYAPAPVAYAPPPVVYAPPVAPPPAIEPVPVAPAPIAVDHWDTGGFGGCGRCGGCGGCGGAVGYAPQIAPSPLYVVNQGPQYSGPGLMIPIRTYSPDTGIAAPAEYPYIGTWHRHYVHPYYRARYAYHPRYYGPAPYGHGHWYRRPLGMRG